MSASLRLPGPSARWAAPGLTETSSPDYFWYVRLEREQPGAIEQSLFAPEPGAVPAKPACRQRIRMRALITVKAAPNPSERYGKTVCVAGLRLDPEHAGWVRLYPINFRELESDSRFRKYDVVSVTARPSPGDPRAESWPRRLRNGRGATPALQHLLLSPLQLSDLLVDALRLRQPVWAGHIGQTPYRVCDAAQPGS